ncbi:N-acetylglucosamine kinase [Clostridium sp.]|uniref:N-acetylglucosamine kinase n=1 Tax=Clostridium sp. TaxID=1506 RepID=UPI002FC8B933
MYYLGVDGGGTKTKYVLINNTLETVGECESSTIHIHQVGIDGIKSELKINIKKVCEQAGIEVSDIKHVFLGVPGYGESLDDKNKIDKAINEVMSGFMNVSYTVDNDAVNGWAAGTACKPGINIVAGTGSIAYGRNKDGKIERSGGWGPTIGDDGSAYWIGLKTINAYTKQKDGRAEKTVLVDILEENYNIKYHFEIVDIIFNRIKLNRTEIAGFSKICFLAAEKGCPASIKIFEEAAINLYEHIKVLADKLQFNEEFIVSYTGGVFKAGKYVLEPLKLNLSKANLNYKIQEPELEPWNGAALLAFILDGNDIPSNYKEVMKK